MRRRAYMLAHALFIDELLVELHENVYLLFQELPSDIRRYLLAPMVLHPYEIISCTSDGDLMIRAGDRTFVRGNALGPVNAIAIRGNCWLLQMDNESIRKCSVTGASSLMSHDRTRLIPGRLTKDSSFRYRTIGEELQVIGEFSSRTLEPSQIDGISLVELGFAYVVSHRESTLPGGPTSTVLWNGDRTLATKTSDSWLVSFIDERPVAVVGGNTPKLCLAVYPWGLINYIRVIQ